MGRVPFYGRRRPDGGLDSGSWNDARETAAEWRHGERVGRMCYEMAKLRLETARAEYASGERMIEAGRRMKQRATERARQS